MRKATRESLPRSPFRSRPAAATRFRECLGLRYKSQRLSLPDRWLYRAEKLFKRAGCTSSDDHYWRPKRMRWARFNRLIDEAELNENAAFGWRMRGFFKPQSSFSRYLRKSAQKK